MGRAAVRVLSVLYEFRHNCLREYYRTTTHIEVRFETFPPGLMTDHVIYSFQHEWDYGQRRSFQVS